MSHEKEYGRDVAAGDSEPVRFWGSKSRQTTPERDRSRIRDRRPTAGSVAEALARETGSVRDDTTKWVGDTAMRNAEHDARLAEAKSAAAAAATGLRIAEERAERAEAVVARMQAELLDAAVADVAVHGYPAYHGDSCHSMHAPARRIARTYAHVRRTQGAARAASSAHSAASSLALATRACGNDIPRLLFWWSNCIILRELLVQDQESDGFGRPTEERTPSRRISTTLSDRRESGFLSNSERHESGLLTSDRRESGVLASDRRESSYLNRRESGLLDPNEPGISIAERIERRQSGALRSPSPLRRRSEEPAGIRMSRQTSGAGYGAKVEDCSEQTEEFMANLKHLEEFIHKKVLLTLWKEVVMPVLTGVSSANQRSSAVEPSSPRANGSSGTSPLASLRNRYFPSQESNPIQPEPVATSVSRRQSTSSLGFGTVGRATSRARGSALVFPTVGEGSEIPPLSGNKPGRRYPGGTECIEAWCSTFTDMKKKLCPARALGHDCGCLFWMTKLTLEQLAQMLDVALFNAILRDLEVNEATDSITDPCTDPRVLPLTSGVLTFGGGVQLKIAVAAWTDWVTQITAVSGSPTGSQSSTSSGGSRFIPNSPNGGGFGRLSSLGAEAGDVGPLFPLLRETADLLMLPKDMLMDKAARTEIFSTLTLPLIRRVIYLFVPDENTPEPLPPSLLAAFNAEVSIENRKKGLQDMGPSSCPTAPAANTPYVPPPSNFIREITTNRAFENQDLSARGYESDEELFLVESPMEILVKGEERPHRSPLCPGENPWSAEHLGIAATPGRRFSLQGHDKLNTNSTKEINHLPGRFRLLQQFWGAPHSS